MSMLLVESEGVRIGHHHGRYGIVEFCLEVFHVDCSVLKTLHLDHLKSANGSRSGVGAVGRVGDNHLGALLVAAASVVCSNDHESCQLSMSACEGVERELTHARQFAQHALKTVVHLQRSLACLCRLKRMERHILAHSGYFLVDDGVVLHRARAERIEPVVHSEVVAAEVGVVANNGQFVALRHLRIFLAAHGLWQFVYSILAELVLRQGIALSSLMRQLEYQVSV